MKLAYRLLSNHELKDALPTLSGWGVSNGMLEKEFTFGSYQEGLVFATGVGLIADKLNHHPDLAITYKKVKVSVETHDVGGLSPYDLELAHRIESAFGA